MIPNYHSLIEESRDILLKLSVLRNDCARDLENARNLLMPCSVGVVQTVCVIMIIGFRNENRRHVKLSKNPAQLFRSYANDLWNDDPGQKEDEVLYITGKRDMVKHLRIGMTMLGIVPYTL